MLKSNFTAGALSLPGSAACAALVPVGLLPALTAWVLLGRGVAVVARGEWMAQIGASRSVAVDMLGKVKTVVQMIAIPFLLYHGILFGLIDTQLWGTVLIIVSPVLTIWSMVYSQQTALPEIRARVRSAYYWRRGT